MEPDVVAEAAKSLGHLLSLVRRRAGVGNENVRHAKATPPLVAALTLSRAIGGRQGKGRPGLINATGECPESATPSGLWRRPLSGGLGESPLSGVMPMTAADPKQTLKSRAKTERLWPFVSPTGNRYPRRRSHTS